MFDLFSSKIKCKTCKEKIAANASPCPKCGEKKPKTSDWETLIGVFFLVMVIAAIAGGGE